MNPDLKNTPRVRVNPSTGHPDCPLAVEHLPEHNLILAALEMPQIVDEIHPGLFFDPAAQEVFAWIQGQRKARRDVPDMAVMLSALASSAFHLYQITLQWVSDPQALRCPTLWPHWESLCREKAARRLTIDALEAFKTGDKSLTDTVQRLRTVEHAANRKAGAMKGRQIDDSLADMEARYESEQTFMGIDTGWKTLNSMTDGLTSKALWVIAARPAVGKTTWACNLASHVGITLQVPTVLFSLEMPSVLVWQKIFHMRADVGQTARQLQRLSEYDFAKLGQAASDAKESPLSLVDDASSLQSIAAEIRRQVDEAGLKVAVIDYLQRVRIEGSKDDRWAEIGRVSNALKDLAMDTGVTVVALAQLGRSVDKEDREPVLGDLRGSAEIEADADVIAFLWRKAGDLQCTIGKSRMGLTGPVPVKADYDTGRFEEDEVKP